MNAETPPMPDVKCLPAKLIPVSHYTEILTFPFRVDWKNPASKPGAVPNGQTECLKSLSDALRCAPEWRLVPDASIPAVDLAGDAMEPAWQTAQHLQALTYFHQTARSFLFGAEAYFCSKAPGETDATRNDYLRWYRRNDIAAMTFRLANDETQYRFDVVRLDLILVQPDVGLLQIELRANGGADQTLKLNEVQDIRDQVRRWYAPYFSGDRAQLKRAERSLRDVALLKKDGEKFWRSGDAASLLERVASAFGNNPTRPLVPKSADGVAIPKNGVWETLLGNAAQKLAASGRLVPPGDDRLPSMSFVVIDDGLDVAEGATRNFHRISEGDWIRLTYADAAGRDAYPYQRAYITQRAKLHQYDRFFYPSDASSGADSGGLPESTDAPSRILNCGYAFTWVGCASDKAFFCEPQSGAFASFRQIYSRMGLVAYFQRTALLGATARLAQLSWRDSKSGELTDYSERSDEIKSFYEQFIEFTHVFWFDEISPQEQGVDLFAMWQNNLRCKALYDEVRQEIKDLVDYENLRSNRRQANITERFTRTAAVLGGLGVAAGLLGVNIIEFQKSPFDQLLWNVLLWVPLEVVVVGLIGASAYYERPKRVYSCFDKFFNRTKTS